MESPICNSPNAPINKGETKDAKGAVQEVPLGTAMPVVKSEATEKNPRANLLSKELV